MFYKRVVKYLLWWMDAYGFCFIIFGHFMGVNTIIRMCELGQENVQPVKRPRQFLGYIKVDMDRVPQGYFFYVL